MIRYALLILALSATVALAQTYSYTYTDVINPHTGQPIKSIVGSRSDRPEFRYVLQVTPEWRWRRYVKFAVSSPKDGISDRTGSAEAQSEALVNLFATAHPFYSSVRFKWYLAQTRLRAIEEAFLRGQIPPMFDPDLESD